MRLATALAVAAVAAVSFVTTAVIAQQNPIEARQALMKDNGKHVEVALFGTQGTSQELRDVADRVIPITGRTLKDCWK